MRDYLDEELVPVLFREGATEALLGDRWSEEALRASIVLGEGIACLRHKHFETELQPAVRVPDAIDERADIEAESAYLPEGSINREALE